MYKSEDIAAYHTIGAIVLKSGTWVILNDEAMNELNAIIIKYANDEMNRYTDLDGKRKCAICGEETLK